MIYCGKLADVAEWQTRMIQVHVSYARGGSNPLIRRMQARAGAFRKRTRFKFVSCADQGRMQTPYALALIKAVGLRPKVLRLCMLDVWFFLLAQRFGLWLAFDVGGYKISTGRGILCRTCFV